MSKKDVIYSNCFGKLVQNNTSYEYELILKGQQFSFSPKSLRCFLKDIKAIDLAYYLNNSSSIESFYFPEQDILLVLSILELTYLKDLVLGSLTMFELNSILEETIYLVF